jgi:hypothetical protein
MLKGGFMKAIRESIIYILLGLFMIAASFEAGIIWELKGLDSANRRLTKLETGQGELAGKVESHTAMLRGIGKGRMPQVP